MRAAALILLVLIICQATVSADDLPYTTIDMSERGGAVAFALKPDEDVIAVGGKNGVYLFTGAGEEIDHFAEDVSVQALAWTPDGQTLAVATRDNMIFLWTSFSWGYSWRSYYNFDAIDMAFSPDGSRLAIVTELAVSCGSNLCATYAQLNVYDVSAVSPVFSSDTWIWMLGPSHSGPEHGLLDWPTEEMLYVGREEYDTRTWTAQLPPDDISGYDQTADSTGTFVATTFRMEETYDDPSGHGFTIRRPGSDTRGFAAMRGTVTTLAWRPGTHEIVAGDTAGDITLWRVDEAALPIRLVTLQGHIGGILALEWNADGRRLTSLGGNEVFIWRDFSRDISRAENAPAREFSVDGDATLAVWHPVGEWLVVPAAQRLDFYGIGDSTLAFSLDVPLEGEIWRVQFSADGRRMMIAAQDVAVFDVEQTPDGLRLSVVSRYAVVEREHELQKFRAAFAPDGLAVALSFGYSSGLESYDDQPLTTIWRPDTGERYTLPTGYTENLVWSPDSSMLLAGSQNSATVRVFDANTGTERFSMYGLEPYCCGAFSPRSIDWKTETIAFSTWGLVETAAVTGSGDSFSAAAAQRFWSNVSSIALNLDGMLLAGIDEFSLNYTEQDDSSIEADNVVVWDVRAGRQIRLIPVNAESLLWSPDGGTLASLDFNGTDTTFTFWPMIP